MMMMMINFDGISTAMNMNTSVGPHTAQLLRLTIPNDPQRTLLFLRDGLTESVALRPGLASRLDSGVECGTCSVTLCMPERMTWRGVRPEICGDK